MMPQRRKLMLNIKPPDSRYYIYNGGQVDGHDFAYKSGWDVSGSGVSYTINENASYLGENCFNIQLYDNSTSKVIGVSAVDNAGISGSVLNKYASISIEAAFELNNVSLGNNLLSIYSSLDGSIYTENTVMSCSLGNSPAAGAFITLTFDLSEQNFDADKTYYVGYRFQSGASLRAGYQNCYISRIYLSV